MNDFTHPPDDDEDHAGALLWTLAILALLALAGLLYVIPLAWSDTLALVGLGWIAIALAWR